MIYLLIRIESFEVSIDGNVSDDGRLTGTGEFRCNVRRDMLIFIDRDSCNATEGVPTALNTTRASTSRFLKGSYRLTDSGRRTILPDFPKERNRFPQPLTSDSSFWQTRRTFCSKASGSQPRMIHPEAGVISVMAFLLFPHCGKASVNDWLKRRSMAQTDYFQRPFRSPGTSG